ncbi:MAG: diphosphomevalonate decarboxylase [Chloroflexi bacterium]|nr:diphosphomevalonate decarboxylase [Chloroflexota bacterium]
MAKQKASASAHPNIALVKYWGNRDHALRVPLNDSLSMNLGEIHTTTTVEFNVKLEHDRLILNGAELEATSPAATRVVAHLARVRARAKIETKARVESKNNFPSGAGIASSASAFAALTLAATRAVGVELNERELSVLARQGSGSAARSIPPGFVEWLTSWDANNSYAVSVAPPEHWDLRDVIAVVSAEEKTIGSTEGHRAASTSPFLVERLNALPGRFHRVRRAILAKDLALLGPAIEEEAIELHSIAMTSRPPIYYWSPAMVRVIQSALKWRAEGLAVYFTLDAGANVHLICESKDAEAVATRARGIAEVQQVIVNAPGAGARLVEQHLF